MDGQVSETTKRLSGLSLQVSVRVCSRSLKLGQFLNMAPGTILPFEQSSTAPLEFCLGEQVVGEGLAVKIGPKFGLKLLKVGNVDTAGGRS